MQKSLIVLLAIFVYLPTVLGLVSWLMSRLSGWARLARRFRTRGMPDGKWFYFQSGRVGWVDISNGLTVCLSASGMYLAMLPILRLGHPPLLIPWSELVNVRQKTSMFRRYVVMQVGEPEISTVTLPLSVVAQRPDLQTAADGPRA